MFFWFGGIHGKHLPYNKPGALEWGYGRKKIEREKPYKIDTTFKQATSKIMKAPPHKKREQ
jgi:hypothetical protein